MCEDFRNLNKVSFKDNYPLLKMDHILQQVVGAERMWVLGGFPGDNQIKVHPQDQEKIAFTTPWRTFMYAKMPFGLTNPCATFQRAMDISFIEEKDKFVVLYIDKISIFSKTDANNFKHLEKVFLKCRKLGISLDPKKSHFSMKEGKWLGHIIYKYGIKIDPHRVGEIQKNCTPRNKKEIQSFHGRVTFLKRFVTNFAETL